jgi:AraC-like DNA-binding protein
MGVLLDTRRLGASMRAKAMSEFLDEQAGTPMAFAPLTSAGDPVTLEASIASFGPLQTIRVRGSAVQALRGREQLHWCPDPLVSIVQVLGGTVLAWRGNDTSPAVARPGDVLLLDLTESVEVRCSDGFETLATQMSAAELALPPEAIRSAAHAPVTSSTISSLLARQMTRLGAVSAAGLSGDSSLLLGEATLDLARSLAAELAPGHSRCVETLEQTLPARLQHYILAHLGDSDLTPERIARAHFISVRKLYYLWSAHGENLSDWIMNRRLDTAYRMLVAGDERAISEIAHECGFSNFAHFTRRFRQRYQLTPTSVRRASRNA